MLFGTPGENGHRTPQPLPHRDRIWPNGRVYEASNGTLYLRRVEELPARAQVRLARILRDCEVVVGLGTVPQPLDIQPAKGADTDLIALVREGKIRPGLYKRLSAQQILIPPLRARREDIPALADNLFDHTCNTTGIEAKRLTPTAHTLLSAMPWCGNGPDWTHCSGRPCCRHKAQR